MLTNYYLYGVHEEHVCLYLNRCHLVFTFFCVCHVHQILVFVFYVNQIGLHPFGEHMHYWIYISFHPVKWRTTQTISCDLARLLVV